MKKLLLLVFTATLVLFFTQNMFAQQGKTVKVANNNELVKAMNDPAVKFIEITQAGFYDEIMMNAQNGSVITKNADGSRSCTFSITRTNKCWESTSQVDTAVANVSSTGGSSCPAYPAPGSGYGWSSPDAGVHFDLTLMGDITNDTAFYTTDAPGNYILKYTWNATDNAQAQVYLFSSPTIDWLFADDTVCGLTTDIHFMYNMGTQVTDTIVTWYVNGADSSAVYPKDPNPDSIFTFTAPSCGAYQVILNVTNTQGCTVARDTLDLFFYDTPSVNAGPDTAVCGLRYEFDPSYTISCSTTGDIDTVWSGTGPGGMTFSGDTVVVDQCGEYTFTYTVTNGLCTGTDDMVVYFYDEPVITMPAEDTVCGDTATLVASYAVSCDNNTTPTTLWTKVSGPGHVVFTDDAANTTDVIVDTCGLYEFAYTVTNGKCSATDTVAYHFADRPTLSVYNQDTICGFDSYVSAYAFANCGYNDTSWMTGVGVDSIVFDPNATSDQYHVYVPTCGQYAITYHATNGPCTTDTTFYIDYFDTPRPVIVGDTNVYTCSETTYSVTDTSCNTSGMSYTWSLTGGLFTNGTVTATGTSVTVVWGNDYNITGTLKVVSSITGSPVTCEGADSIDITLNEPTLEGQVKYWNSVETYMPSPFATDDYYTIPFDYFYVILFVNGVDDANAVDTAFVQVRLMENMSQLMSYFGFNLDTYTYACDAEYYLKIWDGGFIYHNNPPVPAENATLGNTYTYNNWGGVNATDALAIQLMAASTDIQAAPYNYTWVGPQASSPAYGYYSFGVADVNHTGGITALDALTAKYRAVGLLGSYPDNGTSNQFSPNFKVTGRMVDSLPQMTWSTPFDTTGTTRDSIDVPFNHSGNEYMYFQQAVNHKYTSVAIPWYGKANYINIYYEAIGDVNASYIPPGSGLKAKSAMTLAYEGVSATQVGEEMTIPVSVDRDVEAGAITLSFNYRNDLIEVLGTNYGDDDMFIDQEKGILNIAWFSTEPVSLNENATIAQIRVRVLADIPEGTELFSLNAITELADVNANPISDVNLKTIGVTTDKGVLSGSELSTSNYPNPFDRTTTISYTLPENGKVKVDVYNTVGMLVTTLVDQYQEAGLQNAVFNGTDVKPGVYFYHITVQGESNNYSAVKRMIVVH